MTTHNIRAALDDAVKTVDALLTTLWSGADGMIAHYWAKAKDTEGPPPSAGELAAWLAVHPDVEEVAFAAELWAALDPDADVAALTAGDKPQFRLALYAINLALGLDEQGQPKMQDSPLWPLLAAWQASRPIDGWQERHSMIPAPFALPAPMPDRQQSSLSSLFDDYGELPLGPEQIPLQGYLPLGDGEREAPALMTALLDAAGGQLAQGPAPVVNRLFAEILMFTPTYARDGEPHTLRASIDQVLEWLSWDPRRYRETGDRQSTEILVRAFKTLRGMFVSTGPGMGWWPISPVMLELAPGGRGAGITVVLPESQVGPGVDRAMLRRLGLKSGIAWRLYLALCVDWDRYGGHNGRLVKPTRPEVLRDDAGYTLSGRGVVLLDSRGRPLKTPYDSRAVQTGKREPNPARTRYPEYTLDDLVRLAYPRFISDDPATRRQYRARALRAAHVIEKHGGAVIEEVAARETRYRIMPPDAAPRLDTLP